VVGGVTHGH